MQRSNPAGDFLQFLIGGCLFGGGVFLLSNQVMVRSAWVLQDGGRPWGGWGGRWGGAVVPFGTPGMGLLMIPLAIGVCLLFAGTHRRWANLLVWGSLAALFVGILNSLRMSFMPATLWQLAVYVVMIASGGGLMFRSLSAYDPASMGPGPGGEWPDPDREDLRRQIAALREELARKQDRS